MALDRLASTVIIGGHGAQVGTGEM
jgi:hypothetical protein